jgi:hypothetical protein
MPTHNYIDLIGYRVGRLLVIGEDPTVNDKQIYWLCLCSCDNLVSIRGSHLRDSSTKSCGCLIHDLNISRGFDPRDSDTHKVCRNCNLVKPLEEFSKLEKSSDGINYWCKKCFKGTVVKWYYKDPRKRMLAAAKSRAKRDGLNFNIDLEDIIIPENCPLLNIPLKSASGGRGRHTRNSPTLDKIIPKLGYVKGNVVVISFAANAIKHDAAIDELELLTKNLRRIIDSKRSESCDHPESVCEGVPESRGKP